MARIFDNIDQDLLSALRASLAVSKRADFCVGYLNLRGWQAIDDQIDPWQPSAGQVCRVLVGMQRPPQEEIRELDRQADTQVLIDNATASRLKLQFAAHLREQITLGIPTGQDEAGLRRLARQLRAGRVVVKLFLPYPLHAKLYLLFRDDVNNPITGFVGSSNLTLSGLSRHGELNGDVLDHQGTERLADWFDARWADRWALDVSQDLANIIETSWAREETIPPFCIYLNIAYHLSTEARAGLSQFRLPGRFEQELFEFQKSAVKIAARHLHRRGGVMIGDVVGLGKTMMATALARMFEDDLGYETLIICPKNLEPMWERYRTEYGLRGMVLPVSQVTRKLPDLKRYRLVLIDESHNLRNREGRRYKAISDYIKSCDARVILLTATPYNKTKTDLSSQLRLFIDEKANIGIRPEHHMRRFNVSEAEFGRKHQCKVNSILAIDKSGEFDDWRELIRLYMVRRTRSFIIQHYTQADKTGRRYITGRDQEKRYFPARKPRTLTFPVDEADPADRYARLYSPHVVDEINALHVPRYGLGLYVDPVAEKSATAAERRQIDNLGRAGKRLMGFCRTNLFKRLESSGFSFLQSIDRHILRNQIYLYAIENRLDLPVGVLDAGLLDIDHVDEDADVEQLIQLRERIRQRLQENAEVVGTDEAFFEDEEANTIRNLYTEQRGVLDDSDDEVDLASHAWQIWKQATQDDPELARAVEALPPVVYSAKAFTLDEARFPLLEADAAQGGALVYVKSPEGNDHLAWVGASGETVTESLFAVLRAAECLPQTPAAPRLTNHHDLVAESLKLAVSQDEAVGGGLGRPSSPRRRAYEKLKAYAADQMKTLFRDEELERALDDMYQRPSLETAGDILNRLMRSGVNDEELAEAVKSLREEGRLTYAEDDAALREPRVVCSMGLIAE